MYRMLYNDSFLFDPFDETRIVSSASITTNVNAASYLDFTIAANHPLYNVIEHQSGTVTLYSDKEKLFQGLITDISIDMDGNKSVTCASTLNWLKDVQLRPYSTDQNECNEYEFKLDKAPDSLDAYFQWLIDQYNAQNRDGRRFVVKVNQANDLTRENTVYFASTSPQSVADALEQNILNNYGGYLVLRYEDDELILDLYSDIHEMNEQIIDYGENILDITRDENTEDQYTAVYPLGKTPQYTAEQQKYHDEKDAYDARMKKRDEAEKAAIDKLKKEEDAEQNRINGITDKNAKKAAQDALKRRKDQRQAREKAFSDETKRLQDEQKVKDDKNSADKTKPNPITIESLNDGGYEGDLDIFKQGDVVFSMSYVERYGYKEYVYSETDIDDKNTLLKLAVAKLKTLMAPTLSIDVRAIDQALYNPKHRHLFAGQAVRVRSKIQNVDEFMMVSSIELDLIDPSQTTATLGVAYDTLTGQQSSYLKKLNSQIVSSVDAVDKLTEDVKTTEITIGRVENVANNVAADNELIANTVGDYKWMTDTAWGKADDAQADADKANQGVTDTNIRIDNIKLETDNRIEEIGGDISGINTEIAGVKTEIEGVKQTAEDIRADATAGIEEAKQQAEDVRAEATAGIETVNQKADDIRTEANTAIGNVRTDLAATEAKAEQARQNASTALGGLSSANAQINGLRIDVNRHQENITNIDGEIVGVKDTISGVAETANSAMSVATTNTQAINEQSTRIDTAYADIESARTSISEVKQTADGLKVNLETNYLDKTEIGKAYASKAELSATSESITSTVEKTYATKAALKGLQNIADAAIETWSGQTVPTASNPPASTWTTDTLKRQHSGDIYYDMSTGKSYRWGSADGKAYLWSMIADSDITKAIADAAKAQQTANGAKQDVVNLSNDIKATYTTKSEFKQTSDEIKGSVSEVASANEANAQKIAEVSVKADGIGAKVEEQAETINGHTTTIGQLSMKADGLQTKFEQVSTSLDVAFANSEELLYNGGFEFGMDGWSCSYADMIMTSNIAHSGMKWARTLMRATELVSTKPIKAIKGRRYRFGVWYKIGNGYTDNYGGLRLQKSTDGTNFSDWKNQDITMECTSGGDWRYVYVDGVADDTVRFMRVRIAFHNAIDIFLDDLSIKDITDAYDNAEKANAALTKSSELQLNLDSFKQTVSETYSTKDSLASVKSEFTQTANELKGTIQEQAETINGHATTIGQLSLKADGLQTKFEQVSSDVNQLSKSIPGLINPEFSTGDTYGWDTQGCRAYLSASNRDFGGAYLVATDFQDNGVVKIHNTGKLSVKPGNTYRITTFLHVDDRIGLNDTSRFRVCLINAVNGNQGIRKDYSLLSTLAWVNKAGYLQTDLTIPDGMNTAYLFYQADPTKATSRTTGSIRIRSVNIVNITESSEALKKTSELQQNLEGFRQTVTETYTTKTETEDAINAMQIGGTNLSIANGYYNVSGLKNFTYTPADDQYDFDVSAAASSVWGHQMAPKTRCADQRLYPWGKWGTCTFDVYAERECTFVTDINNGLADGGVGGNDHDLRSKAQMILPDGSMQPIGGNASTPTHITIPAQQWVRIGIVCYNGNQSANPNHADIQDYSSIGFLSLGEDFHVKVRKIKFEVGNKPTAWSPCPLDMLDKTSAATTYTTKSEFTQTKNDITARVEENAESIDGHTTSIGQLQVKADEISSKVEGVTETANTALTQSATAIQNLNGFKQTVEQEYIKTEDANQAITDAIDDISVGGTNMLLDTQLFGQDNPNNIAHQRGRLTSYGTMTMLGNDKLDQSKFNGSFRWRQLPASVSSNNPDGATYQVTIEPGKSYTFSFDALGTAEFWVYFHGPSGYIECAKTICTTGVPGNDGKAGDGNVLFSAPGSKWVHHEITWTLKDSTNPNGVKYILFRRKGTSGYFSILAPKLELGTKATGWSPSPFDSLRGADIKSTYSTKSEVSQTESRITQTVEATYATKTQLSDEMKQSLKTTELRGRMDGNYWFKLGRLTMEQQGRDFHIDYTGGRGYNGDTSQNAQLEIHVRSSNGGGRLFAVTLNRLLNADMYTVKAFAIDATHIDLYMTGGGQYSTGTMAYYGQYSDFSGAKQIDDISTAEGTELTVFEQSLSSKTYVDQTANSVAIGVVEDYKNGKHGDKLTTSADITVLKEEINQTVQNNYADMSEKIELKGSENVVQNPSFEVADFAGWEKHDNWYYNTTGGHTGQNYVHEPINPNADGDELINSGSIKVEFGHTYRVSFWAKSNLAHGVYAYLRYQRKINGAWETSMYSLTTDMIAVGRDWKQITFDIEPEQKASEIRVRIIGRNNSSSGVAFFAVDDVSLTDYSVAKTINTTMSQIDQKADSISQTVTNNYAALNAAIGAVGKRITGLENPNFDAIEEGSNRLTGWTANGPWTRANLSGYSPVQAGSGTYFTGATSGVADQTIALINDGYITTYPGMKLQISLWVWMDDNVVNNNEISIGVIQQNNTITRKMVRAETNSWKQYSATVEIPNNVDRVRVRIGFKTTARSGAIRLDSVSVADVTTANVALDKATTAVQDLNGFRDTVINTYATKDSVTKMQTEWKQTAKGFEASIKESEQAISAVGSGLAIINPGFESGDATGWKSSGFASTYVANGSIYSNTTYRFTGVTRSTMGVLENDGRVSAKVGDYIKVTARILALNNNNVVVNCPCRIGFRSPNGVPYFKSMNIRNTGWNIIESTIQVTIEGLHGFYLDFRGASANLKVLVDDVTMENNTTAVALRTDLETRIAMTSNGVRVGKVVNGAFEGTSALLNSEGSFDILQGEETVAALRSDYVGLMRNSDTNKYRFGVRPYKEHSTGSVDYTYEGVDLQTVGGFSLNGIPAAPASDILTIRPREMTGNNYFIKYNVDTLKNDNAIFINAATLHREYYQRLDEGKPALAVHFKHAVGMTTTKDNDSDVSNDHIDTQVMALNPCLYGIQFVINAQKNRVSTYLDATVKVMKTGESRWINSSALPAFRVIEQGDPIGWLTRTSPMYFVKLDVGYRFGIYISGSSNDFKIGTLNKLIITRMPFSGERMD